MQCVYQKMVPSITALGRPGKLEDIGSIVAQRLTGQRIKASGGKNLI